MASKKRIETCLPYLEGKVLDFGYSRGLMGKFVPPEFYFGLNINRGIIEIARTNFPSHRYEKAVSESEWFDAILLPAVIDHLENPVDIPVRHRGLLVQGGRIVLTTPHPIGEFFHTLGGKFGFVSSNTAEQHQQLLDYYRLRDLA